MEEAGGGKRRGGAGGGKGPPYGADEAEGRDAGEGEGERDHADLPGRRKGEGGEGGCLYGREKAF